MKRKLVKHGEATMMISLPAKWLRENKLSKGDELDVKEENNDLIISLEPSEIKKKETEINLESLTESSIRTIISNTYRLGYDKIKINFDNQDALKIITQVIHRTLLGFEIIEKSKDYCLIENITEPSKEQFENIFSKVFLNIDDLFELTKESLSGKKVEFQQPMFKIQQFDNFCRRIITKNRLYESYNLRWAFQSALLHGSRDLYHLLRYLDKNKINAEKEIFNFLEDCRDIVDKIKQAFLEKDIKKLEKIHESEKELIYKKGYRLLEKTKNPIVVHHIIQSIRNFYLSTSPLIGIII